jgi:hypothetical protein
MLFCLLTVSPAQLVPQRCRSDRLVRESQGALSAGRGEAREPHPDPGEWRCGQGKRPEQRRKVCRKFRSRRRSLPNWPGSIRRTRARPRRAVIWAFWPGNDGQAVRGDGLQAAENELSASCSRSSAYHIIQLTGIKAGKQRSLAEVRSEIEDELKRQTLRGSLPKPPRLQQHGLRAADSLQPAAEKFRLKVRQSAGCRAARQRQNCSRHGPAWQPEGSGGDILG